MSAITEAGKDTSRTVLFGSISTIVTYVLNTAFPTLPNEVIGAILVILFAGFVWVDSYIHNRKDWKANGITPF